jgi:AraC-like DNA-binding protein
MARPRKVIDARQVEALASIMCTTEEIAAVVGCSKDTLERRFMAALENGRLRGKQSIRRKMYHLAMEGNTTMLIWLSKQYLGHADRHEVEQSGKGGLTFADFVRISLGQEEPPKPLPGNAGRSEALS